MSHRVTTSFYHYLYIVLHIINDSVYDMTRILLVVTGASRGLGKAICQAFFEDNADDLVVTRCCLVARSQDGLAATKQSVQEMTTTTPESVSIDTHVVDLGDLDALDTKWEDIMHDLSPTDFDKLILINNAGSIGEIGPMATVKASLKDWQQTINLNVTSLFWTTRVWGQWAISNNLPASLINVSSLVAVQPFPTLSLYSAGKAVREVSVSNRGHRIY